LGFSYAAAVWFRAAETVAEFVRSPHDRGRTAIACGRSGDRLKRSTFSFVAGGSPFDQAAGPLFAKMSEPKGRLIAICMLIGAVAMIGLALSGTLQITAFRPPVVADVVAR